jgi:N-acetylneuraminate synthase
MQITNRLIALEAKPSIIAEMSGNHNRSLSRPLAIIEAAAEAGAHAIKLQTYTADTMTLTINDGEFFISDERSPWKGTSLHDLYKLAHTPWEWHAPIMRRAHDLNILCFSSPFDESAVNCLEALDVPAYEIVSFESVHLPLIRKVASTGNQ